MIVLLILWLFQWFLFILFIHFIILNNFAYRRKWILMKSQVKRLILTGKWYFWYSQLSKWFPGKHQKFCQFSVRINGLENTYHPPGFEMLALKENNIGKNLLDLSMLIKYRPALKMIGQVENILTNQRPLAQAQLNLVTNTKFWF